MSAGVVTRRDVLKASLALSATPFLPKSAWAAPAKGGSFAYFSDTHVSLKRNVAECRAMAEELAKFFKPDFVINGGDVVDYGWKGEYDSYDSVFEDFKWNLSHIPGNHDVRWSPLGLKIFNDRVGAPFRAFEALGCKVLLLDSTVPLSHWGHYESEQLRWAERELAAIPDGMPVIVATHHWVGREQVMVDNEAALMRVLEPYNVKLILTGHGHNDLLWYWDGALCTMNKGLYQGSYQRIDIDWEADRLRLSRRTVQNPTLELLEGVPLRATREKRRVWRVPQPEVAAGQAIPIEAPGARHFRWNDATWLDLEGDYVPSRGLAAGSHRLGLRRGPRSRYASFAVHVKSTDPRVRELWRGRLPGGVMSHLRVEGSRLFVSCMDGSVLAFDSSSGREIWRAKTKGYCHSSPVLSEGKLVVGSADGSVYAFDADNGKPVWSFATGGPVYASAAIAKGLAMIGSGDGTVYGLSLEGGSPKWTYQLPASDTAFTQSVPRTDGSKLYFGAWDKHMYALEVETGELAWRQICTASTFAFSPAIGGPAMGSNAVYVPANGNELYAFTKSDGSLLWKYSSPGDKVGYSAPCLEGDRIYIGCLGDKGQARCVGAADGKEVWCAEVGAVIYDSSPAYGDGLVSVGSVNGTLHLIDAETGAIHTQYRMPTGHFLSSPAMQGRKVFAATYSDELIALEAL